MRWYLIFALFLTTTFATAAPSDSISVYIFLREDCVICQQYTQQLERLYGEFGNKSIHFLGVFPNASSKAEALEDFAAKYQITFPLAIDHEQTLTRNMGATITPQVVIYDHRLKQILYTGRIDDRYARVGKRRRNAQTSELEAALTAIQARQAIAVRETEAIGCLITLH